MLALGASAADRPPGLSKAESDLIDAIELRASMVGVKVKGVHPTAHYLGAATLTRLAWAFRPTAALRMQAAWISPGALPGTQR